MSVLKELLEGNERFVTGSNEFPRLNRERRLEGLYGQSPKAIVVGCADSRVPPEHIFDQGLGDLFVLRVAGNILDEAVIGSIEYAVDNLETPLLMVLSHTNCGAVGAAIDMPVEEAAGSLKYLIEYIKPAVEKVKGMSGDFQDNVTKENARLVVENLKNQGQIISKAYQNKKLKIVAAYYDLETGLVSTL
ncbi:carbonic anhydrase [Acidaminobacter sp. JC074]|uniref:carbonic anhydrase n=1 Tax=Acidaminobacter sp. JC074 TaxID=2530199 RepID=UPI001F0FD05E|nr:carbonic anhydrase [Acidaminobacter sp. JC074]MCH4890734.1 carbonic anhydrase [Acidaminobacter sp. JC074]